MSESPAQKSDARPPRFPNVYLKLTLCLQLAWLASSLKQLDRLRTWREQLERAWLPAGALSDFHRTFSEFGWIVLALVALGAVSTAVICSRRRPAQHIALVVFVCMAFSAYILQWMSLEVAYQPILSAAEEMGSESPSQVPGRALSWAQCARLGERLYEIGETSGVKLVASPELPDGDLDLLCRGWSEESYGCALRSTSPDELLDCR